MNKQAYLDALKQAMQGLPPETVAKTLAYYEQRFIDGLVAGRSEEEVYKELDEPRKVAMTLRANVHLSAFEQKKTPVNLARVVVSFIGLAIFNLFMVIPAMVYASLLGAVYVSAFAFYIAGIALVSSGLSGQNELALEGPLRHVMEFTNSHFDQNEEEDIQGWRMAINNMGVQVSKDPDSTDNSNSGDENLSRSGRLLNRAEAVATGDLRITTDFDSGARTSQSLIGFGLILGGIGLCLISIVVTRYTMIGLKRYVAMNVSLLRGR
ncbi:MULTISPECIES: DUF1700 domain-containing protein [unclassified Duganella]|uniref:DUF1700 domain-containing protein n=1 Tax=unclassified Duganella TaxID=2636909 RepID=UPI000E3562E6|nr:MULTISPECIES: DUF1700 domain-containing protein [unclassified Duganella]RFP13572.1 DUF1700 domain-containing protein [Duganella sp. BJB475]RFP36281.1 DUF1700 domain-containing protein [Duganella sp. BJB476]